MGKDVNEDLIEATIQRVAAARAAQQGADLDEGDEQPDVTPSPKASLTPPVEDAAENMVEATIRRVALEKAARKARPEQPWNQPEPTPEAEKNAAAPEIVLPVAEVVAPEVRAEPREAPRLHAVDRTDEAQTAAPGEAPHRETAPVKPNVQQPAANGANGSTSALEAVSRLELGLSDTAQTMRSLIDRLDSLLPVLERIADAPAAAQASSPQPFSSAQQQHNEWEDLPTLPRMSVGQIPRPSIMRDPSPQTATAEHLVPAEAEVIDTRPIPKPLPPLQIEPRRGFDLLPRTYRITVEDKRRGVDLVPLHRALLSMEGVKDMSLLSYNNGVAIVALETLNDLDPDVLASFVSRAMSRDARVEVHNERTMVVKLAED